MSSNIYEEPNKMMNVTYSKGATEDRGEREERQVDIYNSGDTFTDHRLISTQHGGAHTQNPLPAVHRNPFRAAALILGLLCLLLVVGVIALSNLYIVAKSNQADKQTLKTGGDKARDLCSQEEDSQTSGNITRWVRFRCSCYYVSTEVKMWEESRKACQNRGADLVIINSKEEQEFVSSLKRAGDSWIGLQSVEKAWSWEWVDRSTLQYTAWRKGVITLTHNATVYIDVEGCWNHRDKGSKQYICEKQIN